MPVIFISYRRSDSKDVTRNIYDFLAAKFSRKTVFMDVDNIPLGVSFAVHIKQVLSKTDIALVIIGPDWLTTTDKNGRRRLDDPEDFVRMEIETSLRAEIPVIPVLIGNARIPEREELPLSIQKLVARHGIEVRPDPDFNADVNRLLSGITNLERLLGAPPAKPPKSSPSPALPSVPLREPIYDRFAKHFLVGFTCFLGGAVLLVGLWAGYLFKASKEGLKGRQDQIAKAGEVLTESKNNAGDTGKADISKSGAQKTLEVNDVKKTTQSPTSKKSEEPKGGTKAPKGAKLDEGQTNPKKKIGELLEKAEDEYRTFFRRPNDATQFWAAIKFEMDAGKFDLAALHLKQLLEMQPPESIDKDLVRLDANEGMSSFVQLRQVRQWSDYPPFQKEAISNVEALIQRVARVVNKHVNDKVALAKTDISQMIAECTEAIRVKPQDALAFRDRGIAWLEKKEFDKAIADCDQAIRLSPKGAVAFGCRALAWEAKAESKKAMADYDEAIRLDSQDSQAFNNRGVAWFARKELAKAIFDLDEAVRLNPSHFMAISNRGAVRHDQKDYDKAIADFTEALRIDPGYIHALIGRGLTRHAKAEFDWAIADFDAALKIEPKNTRAISSRQLAWAARAKEAVPFYERARAWHDKKEYDRAIAAYDEAIHRSPNNYTYYQNRGLAYYDQKNDDQAIANFDEALRLNPHDTVILISRGNAWYAKKMYDKALADYAEAIRLDPKNTIALSNRGLVWNAKKDFDRAITAFNEVIRVNPKYALAYLGRGTAWHGKKDYSKAIADFTEAIRLNPKDAFTLESRGRAWREKKDYDKAIADFTEAIRLNPKFAFAFEGRGRAWRAKKNYDKAVADFDDAIRLNPKSVWALNSKAWLLATCPDAKVRNGKLAVELATEALDLGMDNVLVMDTLAAAHAEVGDFAEAVRWQERALEGANSDNEGCRRRLEFYKKKQAYRED